MHDTTLPDAAELLRRWDAQQTAYIRHRAQRFAVMVETIERLRGPAPRVLDLACGPGSLSAALIEKLPEASIVAVDKDPVLLAIASEALGGAGDITIRAADLDGLDWLEQLDGAFDAVVSSTALHWLAPDALARLYFGLAGRVAPGGLLLNADHLLYDALAQPELHRLARLDDEANQAAAFGAGTDSWDQWWALAQSRPDYADAARAREAIWAGKLPPPKVTLGFHLETLRSAGFRQTGTIWQYLDDYVVCAVR
jgi:trans-aconitate methyltransferase